MGLKRLKHLCGFNQPRLGIYVINDGGLMTMYRFLMSWRIPSRRHGFQYESSWLSMTTWWGLGVPPWLRTPWDYHNLQMGWSNTYRTWVCPIYGHYMPLHKNGKMRLRKLGWKGIAYFQTNPHVRNSILVGKKIRSGWRVLCQFLVNHVHGSQVKDWIQAAPPEVTTPKFIRACRSLRPALRPDFPHFPSWIPLIHGILPPSLMVKPWHRARDAFPMISHSIPRKCWVLYRKDP